ncbi:hypothetical protein C8F01DRAFT_1281573 [Mycena amicta]|nr:hypothetical protein C8F01DRAFT_1281573 [Mycena amicta]
MQNLVSDCVIGQEWVADAHTETMECPRCGSGESSVLRLAEKLLELSALPSIGLPATQRPAHATRDTQSTKQWPICDQIYHALPVYPLMLPALTALTRLGWWLYSDLLFPDVCPLTPSRCSSRFNPTQATQTLLASSNEHLHQAHLRVKTFKLQVFCKLTVFFNFTGSFGHIDQAFTRPVGQRARGQGRARREGGRLDMWSGLPRCAGLIANYDLSTSSPDATNESEEAADKCGEPSGGVRQAQRTSAMSQQMRGLTEKALDKHDSTFRAASHPFRSPSIDSGLTPLRPHTTHNHATICTPKPATQRRLESRPVYTRAMHTQLDPETTVCRAILHSSSNRFIDALSYVLTAPANDPDLIPSSAPLSTVIASLLSHSHTASSTVPVIVVHMRMIQQPARFVYSPNNNFYFMVAAQIFGTQILGRSGAQPSLVHHMHHPCYNAAGHSPGAGLSGTGGEPIDVVVYEKCLACNKE